MATKWEKVYVFISSTFNDMHAERDYLVKQVFPELQEWCERRKLRMLDIDLRWGVTEQDATRNSSVVNVCLNRIDECRPFFVCLLGQRYGWVPRQQDISGDTFSRFPGLDRAVADGCSVTELEVLHALVSPFHSPGTLCERGYNPTESAFFYLREASYLSGLPAEPGYLRRIFTDEAESDPVQKDFLVDKQGRLKEQLIPATGRPIRHYQATWSKQSRSPELEMPLICPATLPENIERWRQQWNEAARVAVAGLDVAENPGEVGKAVAFNQHLTTGRLVDFRCGGKPLGEVILRDLQEAIAARYPDHVEIVADNDLQKEIDQQEQFLFVSGRGFIERDGDFAELDAYADGDSSKPFVLTAPAGAGKSMLLANWLDRYQARTEGLAGHSTHFRFVGASDGSTTVYSLLKFLLREIKGISGKLDGEIPDDPIKLREAWPKLLWEAGQRGKTVIVLDALNQLESGLSDVGWIPRQLPENVKLILSFKRGDAAAEELHHRLDEGQWAILAEVKPFADLGDRRRLVQAHLSQYLKDLDDQLQEALTQSPGAGNPLYLKVVLSELRVFGAFAHLAEKIRADFGDSPVSAFHGVLARLENDPAYSSIEPKQAVPLLFGLLAHARKGLSVDELVAVLADQLGLGNGEEWREGVADTIHLFLRQVRPFLARRDGRYDFFYESFKNAVLERYVANSPGNGRPARSTEEWHRMLASYFGRLPTWLEASSSPHDIRDGSNERWPTLRKVSELPYHQTYGSQWPELEATLTDLDFIEAKCTAGLTYDLMVDYDRLGVGRGQPGPSVRTARLHERKYGVQCPSCLCWFGISQSHLGELIDCPACRENLRLNLFVVEAQWHPIRVARERARERLLDGSVRAAIVSTAVAEFADFVRHEASVLGTHPALTFQQAANPPADSAPARVAGQRWHSGAEKRPWVRWTNRPRYYESRLATLLGHTDGVTACAWSPDGRRIVSASRDKTLKVWDAKSGAAITTLLGHTDGVNACAYSPDGRRIVSASCNGMLGLWDAESLVSVAVVQAHTGAVEACAFSPDGKRIVSASFRMLRVWDAESGKQIASLEIEPNPVWSIGSCTYSPDGRRIVSTSSVGLRLWDATNFACLATVGGHVGGAGDCACSPDGRRIVTNHEGGMLKVWDVGDGAEIATLEGHTGSAYACAFSPRWAVDRICIG